MPLSVVRQIKQGFAHLNPQQVREAAAKPVRIGLVAASQDSLSHMETYFVPAHLSPQRRAESALRTVDYRPWKIRLHCLLEDRLPDAAAQGLLMW